MSFREFCQSLPKIPAQDKDYFRLIPQDGVIQTIVTEWPAHNAIWDMNIRPGDGRVFFSVCGEGFSPAYARLYEYIPKTARMIRHFDLEKESIQQDRTIRPSKFHTSIQFMKDRRLIMQTHTTSPAPSHPTWMPESYLNHQWEGFQGSEVFIYDPDKKIVQSKGIIAPYCTLYGGGLSNKAGLYFGLGTFNGYGYIYNLNTGESKCIGQVTDGRSNRLYEGPDGHIYYGTATGHLARLNVDTGKIEILAELREKSPLRHGVFDKDGLFWFSARSGMSLYTYDYRSGECREMGRFFEDGEIAPGLLYCYGFGLDSKGCIWFCSNTRMDYFAEYWAGSRLYKWDVKNGKTKVDFGFIGTARRTVALCAQASIYNDVLFVTDGNHLENPVGIVEIDLSKMTEDKIDSKRPLSSDPLVYLHIKDSSRYFPLGDEEYNRLVEEPMRFCEESYKDKLIQNANNSYASFKSMTGTALWETMGYGNGSVHWLKWDDNSTISGISGKDEKYIFRLKLTEAGLLMDRFEKAPNAVIPDRLKAAVPDGIGLPHVPGRQYLAEAESSVALADGSVVVGTKDMMLCRIKDGNVFGLGAVTTSGGVHCLSVASDGMTVYGVAGYECGKGDIFCYNEKTGLFWLGTVPITTSPTGRQLISNRPWVCEVSPDGKYLAVGALDEMSGVCVFGL